MNGLWLSDLSKSFASCRTASGAAGLYADDTGTLDGMVLVTVLCPIVLVPLTPPMGLEVGPLKLDRVELVADRNVPEDGVDADGGTKAATCAVVSLLGTLSRSRNWTNCVAT